MNGKFTIYKASAGSGKTFTLAADYITMLLDRNASQGALQDAFKHILAVTFTNKATAEMKQRILQHLYGIAFRLEESDELFEKVRERLSDIPEETLRKHAALALKSILHDYDRFSVTTIDSFFQTLLTNLAHELGLSANFRVDLNDREALRIAVERLVSQASEGTPVFRWIIEYINDRMNDGEGWDITKEVGVFAKNLLRTEYLDNEQKLTKCLSDDDFMKQYRQTLAAEKSKVQQRIAQIAEKIHADIMQAHGGYDKFKYGSAIRKFILGAALSQPTDITPTITACAEDARNWFKKADQTPENVGVTEPLRTALAALVDGWDEHTATINSCELSLKMLNPMRLLNKINELLGEVNRENNRILLASTPILFKRIVGSDDAPFVFEKAGIRYNHIMIDEFQDTSHLQWDNFEKLFLENIASGDDCMLVGDVKQSIYRWRGGDWGILAGMGKGGGKMPAEVFSLTMNYRSEANIINFNNELFPKLATIMKVDEIYEDVAQSISPKKTAGQGYVRLRIENKAAEGWQDEMMDDMAEQIMTLRAGGVEFKDMAMLVRFKSDGTKIIEHFAKAHPEIPLVSDEAYLLSASPAVQTIIHALKTIQNVEDAIALNYLAAHCTGKDVATHTWGNNHEELWQLLPNGFTERRDELKEMPLYELCEQLIGLFKLDSMSDQSAYVYSFLDGVLRFLDDNVSDIAEFLRHWEETLSGSSVQAGQADGIQILTIHKSKGLDFHTVFIPSCDWDFERRTQSKHLIWCKPKCAPYNALPLLPIVCGKKMEQSIYAEDYEEEQRQMRIENLNMLYVAMTRPKKNLLIWSSFKQPKGKGTPTLNDMGKLLFHALSDLGKASASQGTPHTLLEIGSAMPSRKGTENTDTTATCLEKNENPRKNRLDYEDEISEEPTPMTTQEWRIEFLQSNEAALFMADDEEMEEAGDNFIERGKLLHNILSRIDEAADINSAFRQAEAEGLFANKTERDEAHRIISRALKQKKAKAWFDGSWEVFNERAIMSKSINQRPDRIMRKEGETVVVDYKFAVPNETAHKTQVKNYMRLLREMGFENVKGCVWYPLRNAFYDVD